MQKTATMWRGYFRWVSRACILIFFLYGAFPASVAAAPGGFVCRVENGALVSLKTPTNYSETEFILAGKRLGDLQLRTLN